MLDRRVFLSVITAFCDMLARPPLSEPALEIYYNAISDMETSAFTRRATELTRTRKYNTLPTAADFLNLPDDADSGMLAAETVLRVMEKIGGDADLQCDDPALMMAVDLMGGWVACCDAVSSYEIDKLGIWKRDFAAVYKAAARRDLSRAPRVLFGRHSQSNITAGYLNPATGELKNIQGHVISIAPWGSALITAGKDRLMLAEASQEVDKEELEQGEVRVVVGQILDSLEVRDGE